MARYLTAPEVASQLRCSLDTIYSLVQDGRLKALRLRDRGRLLFHPADVEAALRQARGSSPLQAVAGSPLVS
jgi:excisionase family DNA binding protein